MTAYTKFDGPLTAENARTALDAAKENGFPEENVLVVNGVFLIPAEDGDVDRNGHALADLEESVPAIEATLDAWGEDNSALEGKANVENVESQSADTVEQDYPAGDPVEEWKGKELDAYAKDHGVVFDSGVTTKAEKVAAIVAAKN